MVAIIYAIIMSGLGALIIFVIWKARKEANQLNQKNEQKK